MATAAAWPRQHVLDSSHDLLQPHPTALHPGVLWPHLPSPPPCAEPSSLVLIVQEVFLSKVLIDPAGSEDGSREAVLADQAQRLQGQAVSSMG